MQIINEESRREVFNKSSFSLSIKWNICNVKRYVKFIFNFSKTPNGGVENHFCVIKLYNKTERTFYLSSRNILHGKYFVSNITCGVHSSSDLQWSPIRTGHDHENRFFTVNLPFIVWWTLFRLYKVLIKILKVT